MSALDKALRDLREYRKTSRQRDELIRAAKAAGADITTISREGGISRPTIYEALRTEEAPSRAREEA
jgi:transcriptional regulator of acetoin/glycerol metabolism